MKLFGASPDEWAKFIVTIVPLIASGLAYRKADRAKNRAIGAEKTANFALANCSYPKCGHVCENNKKGGD